MTRPSKSSFVLDGNQVKVRLLAERTFSKTPVHIDWVRFTVQKRNAPFQSADQLFPKETSIWDEAYRAKQLQTVLAQMPDPEWATSSQAWNLAEEVRAILGEGFTVSPDLKKGHDFYRHRFSIERNAVECGWVGFLASGDSPRQQAQASTIHVNLFGQACTFASEGWNLRLADLVDAHDADLTRADLALDFFEGFAGGLERVKTDYMAGLCDVGGKRPKCSMAGDWCNGAERTFYIGSREAGKQTCVYEKGHQLFGRESGSQWMRAELRYGNKLRVLSSEMLRRPADFFAGASSWHAGLLGEADCFAAAEKVPTTAKLALQTVAAEVSRNVRWAMQTAAPTIAAAFAYLGKEFLTLVEHQKLPGRLQRFSESEISRAFLDLRSSLNTSVSAGPSYC